MVSKAFITVLFATVTIKLNINFMRALTVTFEKLVTGGNYNNTKIGVTLEVSEGEKAQDVLNLAKQFVESQFGIGDKTERQRLETILTNKSDYLYKDVINAEKKLAEMPESDDLPF